MSLVGNVDENLTIQDLIGQSRSLSKLVTLESISDEEKDVARLIIRSLQDFEIINLYRLLNNKLSIYPSRALCISFLSENLEIAKIILLSDVLKGSQEEEVVLNGFLSYVGARSYPGAGATRVEYDLFYDDLLYKANENLGFSLSIY